jgi:hypothetical protein
MPFMPGSPGAAYEATMLPVRALLAVALAAAALAAPVHAAPAPRGAPGQGTANPSCLTPAQRRELVASRKVIPLAMALRAVPGLAEARATRGRSRGDIINARLCRGPNGLVYRLTVLARDGKVAHVTVDAASGKLVEGE